MSKKIFGFLGASLVALSSLSAADMPTPSQCNCGENCACTPQNHCGCHFNLVCQCSGGCECGNCPDKKS